MENQFYTAAATPNVSMSVIEDVSSDIIVQMDAENWDYVFVFAHPLDKEEKNAEMSHGKYSQQSFVDILLGLNSKTSSERSLQQEAKVILRSAECFPTVLPVQRQTSILEAIRNTETEKAFVESCKEYLKQEYIELLGTDDPVSQRRFYEAITLAVARRLQHTCGFTVKLFRSIDDDEIFTLIRAHEDILQLEAERIQYRVQTLQSPFDQCHAQRHEQLKEQHGVEVFELSKEHLARTRNGPHDDPEAPQLDPKLMSAKGSQIQPKLFRSLQNWGHRPDGSTEGNWHKERTWWHTIQNAICYVAADPLTYFAPFVPYKCEAIYQPYYRYYPTCATSRSSMSVFRQVDRIRLISSILTRHIGVESLEKYSYLTCSFAAHEPLTLHSLVKSWATNWNMLSQPLFQIRDYYGEKIALYFAWLEFYTKMLVLPAIVGIPIYLIEAFSTSTEEGYSLLLYSIFIVIWSTCFTELWKRKNGLYNGLWGMTNESKSIVSPPRMQFLGIERHNPISDAVEIYYSSLSQRHRRIALSLLVVLVMIFIVLFALGSLFMLESYYRESNQTLGAGISLINAFQIILMNWIYRYVALHLNDWENHRTDIEYENFLITKVFLFQFVNSFASFFYIAFFKANCRVQHRCFNELQSQLFILFTVRIVVDNLKEIGLPWLQYQYNLYTEKAHIASTGGAVAKPSTSNASDSINLHDYEKQSKLLPYEEMESFDDYNEMVIQFGFITLFVVAFPLTPLLALLNNVIEIHIDSYKICTSYRRPFPREAISIGTWFYFLRFMSTIAIMTNVALLLFTSSLFLSIQDKATQLVLFLVAEHAALGLKIALEHIIRDQPLQLQLLLQRFQHIQATLFSGLQQEQRLATTKPQQLHQSSRSLGSLVVEPNPKWVSAPQCK